MESPPVFHLGEIVVTGERVNLATTISEVTAGDIRDRGAQTVGEALELIPGIDVQVGGKGQSFVKIRGFEEGDLKILFDGVPAQECFSGTLDLSAIPVESIAKITVTKGASSVLYGANTMGGVINIITRKGGKEPITEFSTSFGDYGTQNYILNHGGMLGRFNYSLTYGYRASDGFRLPDGFDKGNRWVGVDSEYHEDGGRRALSDYRKRTINAQIGYEPDEGSQYYLSFDYHNNERGCPVERNRYWHFSQWDQWHLNLVGKKRLSDPVTLKVRGFYVDHKDELIDDADRTVSCGGKPWFDKSLYDDYSVGGEFHSLINFGPLNLLKIGFGYIKDQNKQRGYNSKNKEGEIVVPGWGVVKTYEADTYTFSLEDEVKPIDRLSSVFGLSYDYFNPLRSADVPPPGSIKTMNPQGGLVYNIASKAVLHFSLGKKTRFPHLKELYSTLAGGNPDLKPQKTIAYEVGGESKFSNGLNGWISFFHNDVEDLIERVKDAVGNKMYANIGSATIRGVETGFDVGITPKFWLGANYTYLSARDEENDREMEGRPRHKLNLDSRYRFSPGSSVSLQITYVGNQYEYLYDKETKHEMTRKIPTFFLLNAKVTKNLISLFGVDSEAFISVKNITDKDYDEGNGPMPGRNFLAGLTFRY